VRDGAEMTREVITPCSFCLEPAISNYQRVWIKWKVFKNGDYAKRFTPQFDIQEPIEENNIHVCSVHEQPFLNGEI
jgi:hypothetical protein